jgi:hypothetical protein
VIAPSEDTEKRMNAATICFIRVATARRAARLAAAAASAHTRP